MMNSIRGIFFTWYIPCYLEVYLIVHKFFFQLEIDDPNELTENYIYDEVHPKKNVARTAFPKPKGPTGRGPRRMPRPQDSWDVFVCL